MWNEEGSHSQPPNNRLGPLDPQELNHQTRSAMDDSSDRNNSSALTLSNNRIQPEIGESVICAGNPRRPPTEDKPTIFAGSNTPGGGIPNQASRMVTGGNGEEGPKYRYFDFNFHAMKKSLSSGLLDVALLMANSSQLKHVVMNGKDGNKFYETQIVILSISIFFQIVIGCILIVLSRININEADERRHRQADVLNNIVVVGIFILTVLNVFASSLGISNDYKQEGEQKKT